MNLLKFLKSDEWKILWPFYTSSFIGGVFSFIGIFFIIYLYKLNFSFKEIAILLGIMQLTPIIFEIPTGAIADIYGRKFSTILGYVLTGIVILMFLFIKPFLGLSILLFLISFFSTFCSGADEA